MVNSACRYGIISEIRGKAVPEKLEKAFPDLQVGDVISAESLIADCQHKIPKDQSESTFKRSISAGIKVAYDRGSCREYS